MEHLNLLIISILMLLDKGSYAFRVVVSVPSKTRLCGISEWRDTLFDIAVRENTAEVIEQLPKSVCLLPFPYKEVLLQGETKQLRLYEDRFIKLFEDVMENHEGVVAMGLLADSGVIQTVPLAEVEAFNRMEKFGIFVTLRVVGRAKLQEMLENQPYIKAVCTEISDEFPSDVGTDPDIVADTIENAMITLSSLEHDLNKLSPKSSAKKFDDKFFNYMKKENSDEDDDAELSLDRRRRFQEAYRIALDSDTQGYVSSSNINDATENVIENRSPRELSAVSWAAFMTEIVSEKDAYYRIQAMDETNVFERLKLASYMLREKRDFLQNELEQRRGN